MYNREEHKTLCKIMKYSPGRCTWEANLDVLPGESSQDSDQTVLLLRQTGEKNIV